MNSVHELTVNETYYICLIRNGRAFRSTYLGCLKTQNDPDFYFKHQERKGFKGITSFFGINEIGIGNTKEEAISNYKKWKIELPEVHFAETSQFLIK